MKVKMHNYIFNGENEIYYECGYSNDNSLFLNLDGDKYLITDSRYTLEAKEVLDINVVEARDLLKEAVRLIRKKRVKTLYLDSTKWDFESYKYLSKFINIKSIKNFSHKKREIKSQQELEIIKKAVKIGAEKFEEFFEFLRNNYKSEKELLWDLKTILTEKGKYGLSFEPILAFDENAAKPHAVVTDKVLKNGTTLLLDAGITYNRYCSDRTRTVSIENRFNISKQQKFKDKEKQKIYDTVLKAQEAALKAIKVGVKAKDLDKIARDVIEKAGYGKYFVHSLGHGVGLDIHEWPYINSRNETIIKEGMVFTIEPGIYIPEYMGVRIEDMVCINYDSKVEVLSE